MKSQHVDAMKKASWPVRRCGAETVSTCRAARNRDVRFECVRCANDEGARAWWPYCDTGQRGEGVILKKLGCKAQLERTRRLLCVLCFLVHGSEHEVERKKRNAELEEQMIDDFVVARSDRCIKPMGGTASIKSKSSSECSEGASRFDKSLACTALPLILIENKEHYPSYQIDRANQKTYQVKCASCSPAAAGTRLCIKMQAPEQIRTRTFAYYHTVKKILRYRHPSLEAKRNQHNTTWYCDVGTPSF